MDISKDGVVVTHTPPGCKLGIARGDIISHVGKVDVRKKSVKYIVRLLKSSIGSSNRSLTFTRGWSLPPTAAIQ